MVIALFIINNNVRMMNFLIWRLSRVPRSLRLGCHNTHQLTWRKFLSCKGNPHLSRSDLCLASITHLPRDMRREIPDSRGETGPGRWVNRDNPVQGQFRKWDDTELVILKSSGQQKVIMDWKGPGHPAMISLTHFASCCQELGVFARVVSFH